MSFKQTQPRPKGAFILSCLQQEGWRLSLCISFPFPFQTGTKRSADKSCSTEHSKRIGHGVCMCEYGPFFHFCARQHLSKRQHEKVHKIIRLYIYTHICRQYTYTNIYCICIYCICTCIFYTCVCIHTQNAKRRIYSIHPITQVPGDFQLKKKNEIIK